MTQNILKIGAIIILAVLQITLVPYFGIQNNWPNLVLLVAIVLIISDFETEAWLVASVGGLVLDLASPLFFGLNTLLLIIFVLIMKLLLIKFLTEPNLIIIGILLGLVSVINDSLVMLITKNFIWTSVLANAVYGAIIGAIIYQVVEKIFKKQPFIRLNIQ